MKLTKEQVSEIYKNIYFGYSQRQTARRLKHSRQTIARYLTPEAFTEEYMDIKQDMFWKDIEVSQAERDTESWKLLSIVLGFFVTLRIAIDIFF